MQKSKHIILGILFGFTVGVVSLALAQPTVVAGIDGKVGHGKDQLERVGAAKIKKFYESHEFVLAPAASNVDLKATQNAFRPITAVGGGVPRAHTITIRTDGDITIRFNSTANDPITLLATEGSMTWDITEVTNVFLSSTPGANVKVTLG